LGDQPGQAHQVSAGERSCWPELRRSDLGVLHWECQTNLVSEPNLDKRTANLLSNLTDRNFSVVEGRSLTRYSKSTAIYDGENPGTHKILNSIHIRGTPSPVLNGCRR